MMLAFVGAAEIVPLLVCLAFVAGVFAFLSMISNRNSRAQERLDRISRPASLADLEDPRNKKDRFQGMMETAKALSAPMMPQTELEQSQLKIKLANAGFRSDSAVAIYTGLRFCSLLFFSLLGLAIFLPKYGLTAAALKPIILVAGVGFYLPGLVLWFIRTSRQEQIFLTLPDALDLLVVCVESGLGLDAAMRKVAEEMKDHAKVICEELNLANFQLQMGRPRREVLHDLGVRTGVDDVRRPGGDLDPGRSLWLQHRPGAARAVRLDADPSQTTGRGEGGQDGGAADLPAGAVHLPRDLRGPGRPGGHQHHEYHAQEVTGGSRKPGEAGERAATHPPAACQEEESG